MNITMNLVAGLPGQPETSASVSGDTITVDGTAYDLSSVPDGGHAEPQGDHPFVGPIERIGGELHLTLQWAYSISTAQSDQGATAPVLVVTDGPVPDPVTRKEGAEA